MKRVDDHGGFQKKKNVLPPRGDGHRPVSFLVFRHVFIAPLAVSPPIALLYATPRSLHSWNHSLSNFLCRRQRWWALRALYFFTLFSPVLLCRCSLDPKGMQIPPVFIQLKIRRLWISRMVTPFVKYCIPGKSAHVCTYPEVHYVFALILFALILWVQDGYCDLKRSASIFIWLGVGTIFLGV
ncbi:hypothetical protein BD779DRAFT_161910 [Infundibulicybe gibba]|nr:hypothetical protein BD779DRAFT_161910 [Infundibulicybe gibba]